MKKQLPKKLFVTYEDDHLICSEDMTELADYRDGLVTVGVYELTSTGKLTTRTTFEPDRTKLKL